MIVKWYELMDLAKSSYTYIALAVRVCVCVWKALTVRKLRADEYGERLLVYGSECLELCGTWLLT